MFLLGPVLGLASGPILARCLGAEGRGQFAAIMAPITIAGAIASLGLPSAMVYFAARSGRLREVYVRICLLCVGPALLTYIVMALYAVVVSRNQEINYTALVVAWSAIVVSAIVQLRRALWQAESAWKILDIERGLFAVLRFAAVVVAALLVSNSAIVVAGAALIAFVVSSSILFVRNPFPGRNSTAGEVPSSRKIFRYGAVAAVGTIMTIAGSRLDQLLMPATTSPRELGFYAVAVTVAEVPLVLGTLAARNALTLASQGESTRAVLTCVRVYLGACFLLTGALIASVPIVIPLLFGSNFQPSVVLAGILLTGTLCTSLSLVLAAILQGRGRPGLGSLIPLVNVAVVLVGFILYWGNVTGYRASTISLIGAILSLVVALCLVIYVGRLESRVPSEHNVKQAIVRSAAG
ncbi:lipopolysaccharide biosynthesis protein [Gordonia westfalica]|uniref:lipopolysaccharide biosynthesis protein n=1 Tax=Gordonia westfalica TaxID=158898 RepID=UPI0035C86509